MASFWEFLNTDKREGQLVRNFSQLRQKHFGRPPEESLFQSTPLILRIGDLFEPCLALSIRAKPFSVSAVCCHWTSCIITGATNSIMAIVSSSFPSTTVGSPSLSLPSGLGSPSYGYCHSFGRLCISHIVKALLTSSASTCCKGLLNASISRTGRIEERRTTLRHKLCQRLIERGRDREIP